MPMSCAPKAMNVGDVAGSKIYEFMPIFRNQAFKAVGDAQCARNTVAIVGLHDDGANHVVEAGAQPSAGDDRTDGLLGFKENLSARAGCLETKRLRATLKRFLNRG